MIPNFVELLVPADATNDKRIYVSLESIQSIAEESDILTWVNTPVRNFLVSHPYEELRDRIDAAVKQYEATRHD